MQAVRIVRVVLVSALVAALLSLILFARQPAPVSRYGSFCSGSLDDLSYYAETRDILCRHEYKILGHKARRALEPFLPLEGKRLSNVTDVHVRTNAADASSVFEATANVRYHRVPDLRSRRSHAPQRHRRSPRLLPQPHGSGALLGWAGVSSLDGLGAVAVRSSPKLRAQCARSRRLTGALWGRLNIDCGRDGMAPVITRVHWG